ncbi:MAG: ribosome small subunit-dependent GTPase A [Spirochaetota bacterium]
MKNSATGIIFSVYGRYYTVRYEQKDYICVLRGKLRLSEKWSGYSNPAAVGDIVEFIPAADLSGTITAVCDRRNVFSRKDKKDRGKNRQQDIIAANIDMILIMQSFYDPHLNLRFVDRIAVRGAYEKIPAMLCVNKLDLAVEDYFEYIKDYYEGTDLEYCYVSARSGEGLAALKKRVQGQRVLIVGYSGVGKSSLLSALYPEFTIATSAVSESTGKGRHTTTNVRMFRCNDGTELIDTPGVREFGLMDIEPHMIGRYFYEFRELSRGCSFAQCTHDHEPGCEIKRCVDEGIIAEGRYISYMNILASVKEYYDRIY